MRICFNILFNKFSLGNKFRLPQLKIRDFAKSIIEEEAQLEKN